MLMGCICTLTVVMHCIDNAQLIFKFEGLELTTFTVSFSTVTFSRQ